jgi:cell division protein YceG involved in septum cleavage
MSIKRQIQSKYRNMVHALQTISVPHWLTSTTTRLGLLSVIFLFGIAYIINTAASATSGYQMHELEKQTLSLETEVRKLEVEIADNSSMSSISSRLVKLNMVEASNIKYLAVKNTAVAKK